MDYIIDRLDLIADKVENLGFYKEAYFLDSISNTLELRIKLSSAILVEREPIEKFVKKVKDAREALEKHYRNNPNNTYKHYIDNFKTLLNKQDIPVELIDNENFLSGAILKENKIGLSLPLSKDFLNTLLDDALFNSFLDDIRTFAEHEIIHKKQQEKHRGKKLNLTGLKEYKSAVKKAAAKYYNSKEFSEIVDRIGKIEASKRVNSIQESLDNFNKLNKSYQLFKNKYLDDLLNLDNRIEPEKIIYYFFWWLSAEMEDSLDEDYLLSHPDELTAYANTFVVENYQRGLSKEEIIQDIKEGKDKTLTGSYISFKDTFKNYPKVINKFKKIAVEYANKLEERYNKY